ncbi:tRNA wybutosine-synthesizing protein 2 homolog [Stegostoma tigrinum]|uniref:tRNA wybutosine-synthesizing protein 2 homolog n=1 Tax=Stegostoma tigrinum TaxID=3053191 RepID=UPI00202B0246|nr:tRNA wybutosine-synthesizing protein 2 homolog [Stegostoma tigrinum]XP_048400476.1 tRNA wybutosine-synthesizing protein 2 homolog [Stegostoma tigrinum]XP_059507460.1 tRNA wybutosine-synthesizing protein 2 homolog [Stegostoma tigrinum]
MQTEAFTIVTQAQFAQQYREYLEANGILDTAYRLQRQPDGAVALPVLSDKLSQLHLLNLSNTVVPGSTCTFTKIKNPILSKKSSVKSCHKQLQEELSELVKHRGVIWNDQLSQDLPRVWKRHGDMIILNEKAFQAEIWKTLEPELWQVVANVLGAKRIAKAGRVSAGGFRTPKVTLLLGNDAWVHHIDNGIRYTFDVTKCMFSSGNITEKLRVSSFDCTEEVVVDLYAGIGYFTLPFLMHAGAIFVHACEWNPHAVAALLKNLELNKVSHRCKIHKGDNRQLSLRNLADRVNLGLIPSSEDGWPIACQLLREDKGGILHIHHNISLYAESRDAHFNRQNFDSGSSKVQQESLTAELRSLSTEGSESGSNPTIPAFTSSFKTCTNKDSIFNSRWKGPGNQSEVETNCGMRYEKRRFTNPEWQAWAETVALRIKYLLETLYAKPWWTNILYIEHVKSYAPHIDHVVLDLECRPCDVSL